MDLCSRLKYKDSGETIKVFVNDIYLMRLKKYKLNRNRSEME